jgi:D-tyrosyl-tRNA(Tyr) deacylase
MKGVTPMRFLIQRVSEASCSIDGVVTGQIGQGFMVLIGVTDSDTTQTADKMVKKMLGLRIFEDEAGKTNLSLEQVGGGLLLISQFTLYADCKKGNRPSFLQAGNPDHAKMLYEYIIELCKAQNDNVQQGSFGADMKIALTNDGPFTIYLDSDQL